MLTSSRSGIGFGAVHNCLWFLLKPLCNQKFNLSQTLGFEMGTQAPAKRPVCPSCAKPARICLCARMKTPLIDNSVAVTIIQHSQEKSHPLNSTRIATLGLKNLTIATVSDVHSEARFLIHLLKPESETTSAALEAERSFYSRRDNAQKPVFDRISESRVAQKPVTERELETSTIATKLSNDNGEVSDIEQILVSSAEKKTCMIATNAECDFVEDINGLQNPRKRSENTGFLQTPASFQEVERESTINRSSVKSRRVDLEIHQNHLQKQPDIDLVSTLPTVKEATSHQTHLPKPDFDQIEAAPRGEEEPVITATITKCGFTCSLTHLQTPQNQLEKPDFDQLLVSQVGQDAISKGFVVKKLQKKQLNGCVELEENEEFEIVIPPGSALLFPANKSIGVEAVDFEVKHLIVLDGTWGKAKRMFHENPWLKLLPHLKLDPSKTSLYSEVRHQPKAGCLSTIESIVYALKALGDDHEGLDDLLDVFESMVGDQRRCRDERLSKISPL